MVKKCGPNHISAISLRKNHLVFSSLVPSGICGMHCPTEPAIDASSDHAVPWTLVLLPGNGTFQKHMVTCMIHMKLHVQLDLDIHSSIFQYNYWYVHIKFHLHPHPSNSIIYRSIHLFIQYANKHHKYTRIRTLWWFSNLGLQLKTHGRSYGGLSKQDILWHFQWEYDKIKY